MRIAHLAPAWIAIPPKNYGGTENVIYNLIEEQVTEGHNVTLFAAGDAGTSARHISFFAHSLLECGVPWQSHLKAFYHLYKSIDFLKKHVQEFDIVHMHLSSPSDMYAFPLLETLPLPCITTLHSQFPFDHIETDWRGDADAYYMEWLSKMPMVAISESARNQEQAKFPLNFVAIVHHGLKLQDFPLPTEQTENFFVWLGRLTPDKGAHLAVEACRKAGARLVLAGIIDDNIPEAQHYFHSEIEPEIDGQQISYIGPVDRAKRNELLRKAQAMLNPLQWEEPFGMVMLEAMAAGCPVIAFRRGAAPEIITSERVGFLVETVEEMVERMACISSIDRKDVREHVEMHFSAETMAKNYLRVYQNIRAEDATCLSNIAGNGSMLKKG